MKPHTRKVEYQRKVFAMRQIRDCVEGSDAIKRAGQLYAPMPSGMVGATTSPAQTNVNQNNPLADKTISITEAPWHHPNPAYSAYIHRAKFPDMTANTLRGLVGIATRNIPEVKLPSRIAYLEDLATVSGGSIYDLFENCVSELVQVGRYALVLDLRKDNTLFVAEYDSESYINWKVEVIDGATVQTYAEFETVEYDDDGEEHKKSLTYSLEIDESGSMVCVPRKYTDGKLDDDEDEKPLVFQGKTIDFIPVVNLGSECNNPEPDAIPLLGVSDCALDIYRHSADLNQSHFMTCNPTLVFTGVDEDDAPRTIGATVAICLSDPQSNAFYISNDTSALTHVQSYIQDVFQEAVHYGAQLLGPTKKAAESAEALALRQASSGATLVTIVTRVGAGIQKLLDMAVQVTGATGEITFEPNIEFAEMRLSSQDITALLNSWMSGGISKLTYLENLSAAGILQDRTPEEEIALIEEEGLVAEEVAPDETTDQGNSRPEAEDTGDE